MRRYILSSVSVLSTIAHCFDVPEHQTSVDQEQEQPNQIAGLWVSAFLSCTLRGRWRTHPMNGVVSRLLTGAAIKTHSAALKDRSGDALSAFLIAQNFCQIKPTSSTRKHTRTPTTANIFAFRYLRIRLCKRSDLVSLLKQQPAMAPSIDFASDFSPIPSSTKSNPSNTRTLLLAPPSIASHEESLRNVLSSYDRSVTDLQMLEYVFLIVQL